MVKKRGHGNNHKKNNKHPLFKERLSIGQKAADKLSTFGGSWTFIIIFGVFILIWMSINTWMLVKSSFDPYPFILLNLVLSCLAAIQAPIILMAQNRQAERDRIDAKYNYSVNRKAEREIQKLAKDLDETVRMVKKLHDKK
jgi:uncharacterized membrane protein